MKQQKNRKKLTNTIKQHKLVAVLMLILFLVLGNMAYEKYLDWDNAQMIKGLARDFPALVHRYRAENRPRPRNQK